MRAAVVERYGSIRHFHVREWPDPRPGPGELLIRVRAIGLNFADIMSRFGVYPRTPKPPFVPGLEFAGEVIETGSDVKRFTGGERVLGFAGFGSHAERVAVSEMSVTEIPDSMSWEDAASLMVTYLTAYHALKHLGNCRPGERVLIHAAAGGVGTAAIQLAKHFKLETIGTAGTGEKCELAEKLGADLVINYREKKFHRIVKEKWGPCSLDLILDGVGGELFTPGWKLLAPMGRYILFGVASITGKGAINRLKALYKLGRMPRIHPFKTVSGNRSLMGFNLSLMEAKRALLAEAMGEILKLYEEGVARPLIGRVYPFEEIGEAHLALQTRQSVGKVVVTVEP